MSEFVIEHPYERLTIKNSLEPNEFLDIFVTLNDDEGCFILELETAKELVQYLTDKINTHESKTVNHDSY